MVLKNYGSMQFAGKSVPSKSNRGGVCHEEVEEV
jgi:hypothetical protein